MGTAFKECSVCRTLNTSFHSIMLVSILFYEKPDGSLSGYVRPIVSVRSFIAIYVNMFVSYFYLCMRK